MTVKLEGFEELSKKITDLASMKAVGTGLQAGALHMKGAIAKYPPKRVGSTYRRGQDPRSERLGQSWTIRGTNRNLTWTIGNDTSYGPWVQDALKQVWFHRDTGWNTTQAVVDKEGPKVLRLVTKQVDILLKG